MEVKFIYVLYVVLLLFSPGFFYIHSVLGGVKKPNVVLITVNHFGLNTLDNYRGYLKNIRRLSEESIQFSHAYSQLYPTSSRAALLTGRLPVKTGMLKGRFLPFSSLPSIASSGGLPLNEETLAESLEKNGYTNKFIGLWDQGLGKKGKYLPLKQGFRSWFGIVTQHSYSCSSPPIKPHDGDEAFVNEALWLFLYGLCWSLFIATALWCLFFLKAKFLSLLIILGVVLYATNSNAPFIVVKSCVLFRNDQIIAQPYNVENITLRFTDDALDFIKTAANPFFLMVNHLALSQPLFTSPFFKNTSGKNDVILDSLVELDWSVGSILAAIESSNLTDDTIIVFTALSGEIYSNNDRVCNSSLNKTENNDDCHPRFFRENVMSVISNWERHIKVPLFIKWPKFLSYHRVLNQTVTLMDVMPTILDLANASYSSDTLHGKSLCGVINGTTESLHSYIYHYLDVTRPSAITHNEYKLLYSTMSEHGIIHHDPPILFNIRKDPGETSPLINEDHLDIVTNISEARDKHLENRTRKWISQFEYPILPWLFPCANFPYCHRRDISKLKHIFYNESGLFS
ncbi:arylsulfatase-like isoform X1 [Dendronephthya gigantea]|uniref:arylsulfatase-like isoform X1 n=1 Tax=Dendronephthya gigantea TaxID=151771 RepID=UPI00106B4EAA|nr:arylsulfatase-like isoform X1 [Dendronephthya gigantea]